jgi:hypothetical protein
VFGGQEGVFRKDIGKRFSGNIHEEPETARFHDRIRGGLASEAPNTEDRPPI